ncbi:hypothetical protein L0F63_001485 [Massospora cicadina]|nr:hypothetical protein L0F63_001485 [Massospora cicadina]
MSGSYEEQLKAQQEMQKQQLQAQIDMQNKIISDHNEQIARHQQQQLQAQSHHPSHPTSYNPSANATFSHDSSANTHSSSTEKPQSQETQQGQDQNYPTQAEGMNQSEKPEEQNQDEDPNATWKIAAGIGGGLIAAAGLAYGGYKVKQHFDEKEGKEEEEAYRRNLAMHPRANAPRMPYANQVEVAPNYNPNVGSPSGNNQGSSNVGEVNLEVLVKALANLVVRARVTDNLEVVIKQRSVGNLDFLINVLLYVA